MPETEVGSVTHYFDRPHVAIIKVSAEAIAIGDTLHFKGAHTDLTLQVSSMEFEHRKLESVKAGEEAGIQVPDRCRTGDKVYKVTP